MGNKNSRVGVKGKPFVIVIGGGFAGANVARMLDSQFNVLLIERRQYRFNNVAALRSMVNEETSRTVAVPYGNLLKNGLVVQAEVQGITEEGVKIAELDAPIKFDYVIVATGSSYSFPTAQWSRTVPEMAAVFAKVRKAVESAKSVVVVGAGAVGLELAGEISNAYSGQKAVTIVQAQDWVAHKDAPAAFQESLKTRITSLPGVKLVLGEKVVVPDDLRERVTENGGYVQGPVTVTTDKGTTLTSDLVFFAVGGRVNSNAYEHSFPPEAMDEFKRLKVNEFMQVTNLPGKLQARVFALGDCSDIKDWKLAATAGLQAEYLGKAFPIIVKGQRPAPYKPSGPMMFLSLGLREGAGLMPNGMMVGRTVLKMAKGTLLAPKVWKENNADYAHANTAVFRKDVSDADVNHLASQTNLSPDVVRGLFSGKHSLNHNLSELHL